MKNALLLIFFLISSNLISQNTLLFENFNDGMPAGWQTIDEDGLVPYNDPSVNFINDAWEVHEDYDSLGIADSIIISTSWFTSPGVSDDYIVLPAITLGAYGNYISFDCKSKDQSYPDDFEIRYSHANLNDFTNNPVIFDSVGPSYWTNYTVSLDSAGISGETVYLAFRHNAYDKFILELDNIKVISESPMNIQNHQKESISVYPNPATNYVQVSGIEEATQYTIADMNGKIITNSQTTGMIHTDYLSKGFYLLTINGFKSKKLVIK